MTTNGDETVIDQSPRSAPAVYFAPDDDGCWCLWSAVLISGQELPDAVRLAGPFLGYADAVLYWLDPHSWTEGEWKETQR